MFGVHDLALFVAAGLLLNVTPGPDTLYILSRTAGHGWRGGAVAALGIGAGCFAHICAAALGLSALLAASATAFTVLKWLGGAYLVWMGLVMLRAPVPDPAARSAVSGGVVAPQPLRRIFAQGFATNALNPKVALFFLAFLPQFIDPNSTQKALAFALLGLIFNFNATLWNLFVAWSAAKLSRRVGDSRRVRAWINRAIGGVFIFLGVRLATATY
jgi:threonine/homoserine/homoserine lactone efflux protein